MNYNIFFPIQLWNLTINNSKKYRLQPPRTDTFNNFKFYNHFIDEYNLQSKKYPNLRQEWTLETTIWGINPKYINYLRRGLFFVKVYQNYKFPFNSDECIFTALGTSGEVENKDYFVFGYYKYPIIGSTLLFISTYVHTKKIKDIILLSDTNQDENNYNFLPYKKNKDIPFYNLFHYHMSNFLFIFHEKPKGNYWKSNQENICIPSTDPNDYKTSIDCIFNNNDKIYPKNIFLESNNLPLFSIINPQNSKNKISLNYILILSIIILLLLILSQWLWKRYKLKLLLHKI